jgi:hypothetical protein
VTGEPGIRPGTILSGSGRPVGASGYGDSFAKPGAPSSEPDARTIMARHAAMKAERSAFETLWDDLARFLLPRQSQFLGRNAITPNPRPSARIFDETAQLALERGIAIFLGYVMPRGARWQTMTARDDELMKLQHVREWYERKTAQLFALRSNPQSGFDTQTHESAASLLAFGMQGMWPEARRDWRGRPLGIFYRSEHIGQVYCMENAWGAVDIVHREFRLTARQALQRWPDNPPECALKAVRDRQEDAKHSYIHALEPNARADDRRIDAAAMPISSAYLSIENGQLFDTGGYRSMPLIVSRFDKAPGESYGRSPGMTVLPAVRQCQAMVQSIVVAAEFSARPAMLAVDDMLDKMVRMRPGGMTYGGIDERGNPTIRPMMPGVDLSPAREMLGETRQLIGQAFFNDLMLGGGDGLKSHVTDAQLLDQQQDKGVLLAPLGRQETEWFDPMGAREADLMGELGLLDDMPPEVREAGGAFQMRYENPLARAQRSEQAAGYFKLIQAVTPLAQADPTVLKTLQQLYPPEKVLPGLADIFAVPAAWAATDQEKQAAQDAEAQAQQSEQLLNAAPVVAKTVKDMSAAEAAHG